MVTTFILSVFGAVLLAILFAKMIDWVFWHKIDNCQHTWQETKLGEHCPKCGVTRIPLK